MTVDQQMIAVRIMAEAILDLRALDMPLMTPPPLPLASMLTLTVITNDPHTFQFALREFAQRTRTILDMQEALDERKFQNPF